METPEKRLATDSDVEAIQQGNRSWWTRNTMSYDWKDKVQQQRGSAAWFDEIDQRFTFGARLFAHDTGCFDRILPQADLAGKRTLEIGCGMGLHTELISRAGADHAATISPTPASMLRANA